MGFFNNIFQSWKEKKGTLSLAQMKNDFCGSFISTWKTRFKLFIAPPLKLLAHKLFIVYYKLHITCNIKIK